MSELRALDRMSPLARAQLAWNERQFFVTWAVALPDDCAQRIFTIRIEHERNVIRRIQ